MLCRLVDIVVAVMGDAFPELTKNQAKIKEIISEEETSFSRTLVKVIGYSMLMASGLQCGALGWSDCKPRVRLKTCGFDFLFSVCFFSSYVVDFLFRVLKGSRRRLLK